MQRRTFFGGLMALIGLGSLVAQAEPKQRPKIRVRRLSHTAQVEGDPNLVREFVHRYQTELWPEWRTHKCSAARDFMAEIEPLLATGRGGVAIITG